MVLNMTIPKLNILIITQRFVFICSVHGEFWQSPHHHLNKQGCPICANKNRNIHQRYNNIIFINKSKIIHNNKFKYSKVIYTTIREKICIICPVHGEFWQLPSNHLVGKDCPNCNESKIEKEINLFLIENEIKFEREKHFNWLGKQELDFYLPDYNIGIECQGRQHFEFVNHFHRTQEGFINEQRRDDKKFELCKENGIKLLYFTEKRFIGREKNYLGELIINTERLLETIKS